MDTVLKLKTLLKAEPSEGKKYEWGIAHEKIMTETKFMVNSLPSIARKLRWNNNRNSKKSKDLLDPNFVQISSSNMHHDIIFTLLFIIV